MFAVLVVLPTPPLPLVTTMTRESPAGAPPASSPKSAVAETRRTAPPDNKPRAKSVPSQRGIRYRSREYRSTRSQQVAASRRAGGRSAGESALTGALLGYAEAEANYRPYCKQARPTQCSARKCIACSQFPMCSCGASGAACVPDEGSE